MKVVYRRTDLADYISIKVELDIRFRLPDYAADIFSALDRPVIYAVMHISRLPARYTADVVSYMLVSDIGFTCA